jgi:DNA-binding XRE family transcriptional regulator
MELDKFTLRDLGALMQKVRNEKKINQDELAEKIGVSSKTISVWETGKKQPGVMNLLKYCSVLGVTIDDLLGVKKNGFSPC